MHHCLQGTGADEYSPAIQQELKFKFRGFLSTESALSQHRLSIGAISDAHRGHQVEERQPAAAVGDRAGSTEGLLSAPARGCAYGDMGPLL